MSEALANLREKIVEWAVMAALVGVIGYLIGNSDATTMKAENDRQTADIARLEAALSIQSNRYDDLAPRVLTLEVEARTEREERLKGDAK